MVFIVISQHIFYICCFVSITVYAIHVKDYIGVSLLLFMKFMCHHLSRLFSTGKGKLKITEITDQKLMLSILFLSLNIFNDNSFNSTFKAQGSIPQDVPELNQSVLCEPIQLGFVSLLSN